MNKNKMWRIATALVLDSAGAPTDAFTLDGVMRRALWVVERLKELGRENHSLKCSNEALGYEVQRERAWLLQVSEERNGNRDKLAAIEQIVSIGCVLDKMAEPPQSVVDTVRFVVDRMLSLQEANSTFGAMCVKEDNDEAVGIDVPDLDNETVPGAIIADFTGAPESVTVNGVRYMPETQDAPAVDVEAIKAEARREGMEEGRLRTLAEITELGREYQDKKIEVHVASIPANAFFEAFIQKRKDNPGWETYLQETAY